MGCVERTGYPQCYGALYDNDGCRCPEPPGKKSKLAGRVAELEELVRELRMELEELKDRVEGDTDD